MSVRYQTVIGSRFVASTFAVLCVLRMASVQAGDAGASMSGPTSFKQQDGAALFQAICQGCHMPNAEGAVGAGAYPALAHNSKLAAPLFPVLTVLNGRKSMPALGSYLSDEQVANVVTYVRTHFGNNYRDKITPATVKGARESH
jgi:mono/diheme cytochrome c family protein